MDPASHWIFNIVLLGIAAFLFFNKRLLSFYQGGRLWLTWLAIGVVTLMDELTSIFYAPSEAFRYLGLQAVFFIPLTAIFIHYMTTRMVEIAEILDFHNLKGGGVYNFSYFVLGPVASFIAVASILVDYVLTAAISTVSAVENASYSLGFSPALKIILELFVIWLVAGLNILGIRENMRVTFGVFLITAVILMNLALSGVLNFGSDHVQLVEEGVRQSISNLTTGGFFHNYAFLIFGISSCILAYSGVESVMQTAGLVKDWKVVGRAYIFLALSVGLFTPLISILSLTTPNINANEFETQLMPHFASLIGGAVLGSLVRAIASLTLLLAMNTAYIAISELLERVARRYGFQWIVKTNRRNSLYRVHLMSALFFSLIVLVTYGQQKILADMYAVGLVATFVINLVALLIYRYFKGTKEISAYRVSRTGTLFFSILMTSCFVYLCYHKPAGFVLWLVVTLGSLLIGVYGTRRNAPELIQIERGETPMDLVLYIAESMGENNVHIYFKNPFDRPQEKNYDLSILVTFYSPRQKIPPRLNQHHFRIPFKQASVYQNIVAMLHLLIYELPGKNMTVHFGWPTSSWLDRLSIGVMVFQFMRLPALFPAINFRIERYKKT